MRKKSSTERNTAPEIICRSPWRLTKVKPLENYRLEVEFVDGTHGFVEMEHQIRSKKSGVFSALEDLNLFKQVYLKHGVATWPNGIDLAPDAMHDEIKNRGKWILT